MSPTRRQLLRGVTAGSLASAGHLGNAQSTDGSAVQGDAPFCPSVEVSNLRVRVRTADVEPAPESVTIHTVDGTVHEFTEYLEGSAELGYWARREEHWIGDVWYGAIDRVAVSSGRRTITVENENDAGLEVTCSLWRGPEGASDFTTEYEHATKRYDPAAGDRDVYGSPGRSLQAVYGPAGDLEIQFGARECDPESDVAVQFDCTSVTVEPGEFVNGEEAIHRARLYFADGTDQTFDPGGGEFYEPPHTFAGTDEHEGAVIERLELWNAVGGGPAFLYENPDLDACLADDGGEDGSGEDGNEDDSGDGGGEDGDGEDANEADSGDGGGEDNGGEDGDGEDSGGDGDGSDGSNGASIASVSVDDGPYQVGDAVTATVTISGGDADGEFFLGFSALGPDDGVYTNDGTTGHVVSVAAGETTTATVEWTVEDDAPPGSYAAHVALWVETDPDALETQLDDRIVDSAFEVA